MINKIILIMAGVIILALVAMQLRSLPEKSAAKSATPPSKVSVVTLHKQPVEITTELPGRTMPFRQAEVRPQVSGIIQQRLFIEGEEIGLDQPLYQINAALFEAEVRQRQASLARANAQLHIASQLLHRYNTLAKQNIISRQDYENAESGKNQSQADVLAAQAALDTANINLSFTRVLSPLNGIIGRSRVTEGALVTAQQEMAIATIQQIDPIYVDIVQSSSELLRLRQMLDSGELSRGSAKMSASVQLRLEDNTEYAHQGTLQFAEVTVDRSTGSIVLRALFPNPERLLLPGMFVKARLNQGIAAEGLLIPQRGVTRSVQGDSLVLLVNDSNIVEQRVIRTAQAIDDSWLVTQGVKPGDRVIIEGSQRVKPGMTVAVEEWRSSADDIATAAGGRA